MVTTQPGRITTLDIVRGVGVMGILAMNIVAFSMPFPAYMNPLAYGSEGPIDLASYAFNFVLIDGKMRGLFSFLFGASMLLVIDRAEARGDSPASTHYRRMLVLLLFGALHFYLIWFGDILFGYALIGMLAYFFRRLSVKALIGWGIGFVLVQFLLLAAMAAGTYALAQAMAQPGATAETLEQWRASTEWVRIPTATELQDAMELYRGSWSGLAENQLSRHTLDPLFFTVMFGPETLAYMLFGMAALRSGFLTGDWSDARYTKYARNGLLVAVPLYLILVWLIFRSGFDTVALMMYGAAGTVPVRPFMIVAVAAVVILLNRDSGWLTDRIAAAGRAAFTNYLGTSIIMTGLFYGWGFGLYGELSRAELWLPVIAMWVLMLAWSKPWLERFHYGPLEWLWRSLSRGEMQPMRRAPLVEKAA